MECEREGNELLSWTFLSHFREELRIIVNDFLKAFPRCLRLPQLQLTSRGLYRGSVAGDVAENLDMLIARNQQILSCSFESQARYRPYNNIEGTNVRLLSRNTFQKS